MIFADLYAIASAAASPHTASYLLIEGNMVSAVYGGPGGNGEPWDTEVIDVSAKEALAALGTRREVRRFDYATERWYRGYYHLQ